MNIRRVKRKCSVRGCKNTDCFAISLTSEVGNTAIICPSCAKESAKVLKEAIKTGVNAIVEDKKNLIPPSLFFHPEKKEDDFSDNIITPDENTGEDADNITDGINDDGENELPDSKLSDSIDEDNEDDSFENVEDDEGEWTCSICGRSFNSERGLKVHMRSHEDD